MPTKWLKRIRKTGQLSVYNDGGTWSVSVTQAIKTFNTLGFGVTLVEEKDKSAANIVVKLSSGAETYPYPGYPINVKFPAEQLHGRAKTLTDGDRMEIFFAAVFLPGKVKNPTLKQKEVIIVHELIHASGLNGLLSSGGSDPKGDHDDDGIMYPQMMVQGDGLIEYLHDQGAKPMTPVRVGAKTMSKMRLLWATEDAGKN